jgi:hypothetical protein
MMDWTDYQEKGRSISEMQAALISCRAECRAVL